LNIDEPLARIKVDLTVRYHQTDALDSVIALVDDTGAVKTTYTYDPFGNVTISGEASDNPFQYTGRENDETGLYYYRARYYSPELQRFISEDPIGLAGGYENYFAYTGNNPMNTKDPLGLFCVTWVSDIENICYNFRWLVSEWQKIIIPPKKWKLREILKNLIISFEFRGKRLFADVIANN
jgi:RHS repeat-associated protein